MRISNLAALLIVGIVSEPSIARSQLQSDDNKIIRMPFPGSHTRARILHSHEGELVTSAASSGHKDYLEAFGAYVEEIQKEKNIACVSMPAWCYAVAPMAKDAARQHVKLAGASKNILAPVRREVFISETIRFLGSKFSNYGANIKVLEKTPSFLSMTVDDARGVIVPSKNYWEEIEFKFVVADFGKHTVRFYLLMDARYASGIGKKPSRSSYNDLETDYPTDLNRFIKLFSQELEQHLISKEVQSLIESRLRGN